MKLKDKKVQIYSYVGNNINYRLYAGNPLWAYFRQLSTKEFYAAAATTAKEEVVFIINHHSDIKVYDMVAFRGKYYRVTRIDEFEGYRDDMKLYASTYSGTPKIVQ